jgi:hypothetical protein
MKFDYTQCLLSYQKNGLGQHDFLKTFGNYIQIYVSETPLSLIIADGTSNYLVEERLSVQRAWGPFDSSEGLTHYLYVDVNAVDASITRGTTTSEPVYSALAPTSPTINLHWFDTSSRMMNVWDGASWKHVIRLFVASFSSNALITYNTFSLENVNSAGYIVYDYDNKGVRKSNGKFLTTQDGARLNTGAFSNAVNPEDREYVAQATETIPAFAFAAVAGDNKICVASSSNIDKLPIGMVLQDVLAGQTINLHTEGVVINQQWNFTDLQIGKFLYCDAYGELSFDKALIGNFTVRVGKVLSKHSISVKIDVIESVINGTVVIGQQGAKGDKGDRGDPGIDGINGIDGTNGIDGKDGIDGVGTDAPAWFVKEIKPETLYFDGYAYTINNLDATFSTAEIESFKNGDFVLDTRTKNLYNVGIDEYLTVYFTPTAYLGRDRTFVTYGFKNTDPYVTIDRTPKTNFTINYGRVDDYLKNSDGNGFMWSDPLYALQIGDIVIDAKSSDMFIKTSDLELTYQMTFGKNSVVYLLAKKIDGEYQTIDEVFAELNIKPDADVLYILTKDTGSDFYINMQFDSSIIDEAGHDVSERSYYGYGYGIDLGSQPGYVRFNEQGAGCLDVDTSDYESSDFTIEFKFTKRNLGQALANLTQLSFLNLIGTYAGEYSSETVGFLTCRFEYMPLNGDGDMIRPILTIDTYVSGYSSPMEFIMTPFIRHDDATDMDEDFFTAKMIITFSSTDNTMRVYLLQDNDGTETVVWSGACMLYDHCLPNMQIAQVGNYYINNYWQLNDYQMNDLIDVDYFTMILENSYPVGIDNQFPQPSIPL